MGCLRIVTSRLLFCSRTHGSGRALGQACSECGRGSHQSNAACSHGNAREFFLFCRCSRDCFFFFFSQAQGYGGRVAWRAHSWPCFQEKTVSRLLLEALGRSRSDLDFSLPVVVDDGLVADRHVASKTDCTDNARILQAWCDEHDLKNKSWEQVAVRSSAVLMAILFAKFYQQRHFGGGVGSPHLENRTFSSRVVQRVCEGARWNLEIKFMKNFVCASEPASSSVAQISSKLGGNASLQHLRHVIQSFFDTLSESALVETSNQKFFVAIFRAVDCIADSMREASWPVNSIQTNDESSGKHAVKHFIGDRVSPGPVDL